MKKYFPHDEIRPIQDEFLKFAVDKFKTKKFIVAELPTGVGKSAIAIALSKYFDDSNNVSEYGMSFDRKTSYILTTQKILQEQYTRDFKFLANITAKNNYICKNRFGVSCELGLTIEGAKKSFEMYKKTCEYCVARESFNKSDFSLTNLPYFLYNTDLENRNFMVVDECHNLEQCIVDYASLTFNKYFCDELLGIKFPNIEDNEITKCIDWINKVYLTTLKSKLSELKGNVDSLFNDTITNSQFGINTMKKYINIEKEIRSIEKRISNIDITNWVLSVTATKDLMTLKPIHSKSFTNELLFSKANRVLLMSGTILDKQTYCTNLGLDMSDVEFFTADSPFPVENRPVMTFNIGSMSYKSIDKTLPNLTSCIESILDMHKEEKGIIHCNTYKISNYILNNINKKYSKRLLLHDSEDRMEILKIHLKSDEPTVLVSPSFTEGVDLYGDLSRFQVVCKIPFPFLGDNYIKNKKDKCYRWYEWQTAKTIMQALGRSIRSEEDSAMSYILDSDWGYFYHKNKDLFPMWFRDSIIKKQ